MSMQHLIELQEIDNQLQDLNSLLGDLPKRVNEMNQEEEVLSTNLEKNKIPEIEPNKKNINMSKLKLFTASKTILYFPNKTKI